MRNGLRAAAVLGMLLGLCATGHAADPPAGKRPAADDALPAPEARSAAIRRAIGFLDERLPRLPDAEGTPRKSFTEAVAGLVYLMDDATRAAPPPLARLRADLAAYVDRVTKAVADPEKLPPSYGLADSRFTVQYTWPVAETALFFGELIARGDRGKDAPETLRKCVALLEAAQEENGGWGHGRIRPGVTSAAADGPMGLKLSYPSTLVASTNAVASALGLVRGFSAGRGVQSLDKARAYYRAARLAAGNFPYDPSQRSSGASAIDVGRTGGAVFAMHCLGMPQDTEFRQSAEYFLSHLADAAEAHGSPALSLAHAALACRALGDEPFLRFRRTFEKRIVAAQDARGAFACLCENRAFGVTCDSGPMNAGLFADAQEPYVTALHTFALLLERGNLKILGKPDAPAPVTPGGK